MIKPARLKKGDKIAIVSLSWGGLGDDAFRHKYYIAKERLENLFGLEVHTMPHALKGAEFLAKHPELRAKDLMDAFKEPSIKAIFCAIGGDDTIRLLPYIDYNIIRSNPKIFMGYSDSTANHFMMYKAGVASFYGPSIMCEFGEYVSMFEYTIEAIYDILFKDSMNYEIKSSPFWSKDHVEWNEANMNVRKSLVKEENGYEVLQGKGHVQGFLFGGCLDALMLYNGTSIWPSIDQWKGSLLFLETSEEKPSPDYVKWTFRNLAAQGILKVINGILVGKPYLGIYYEEYKQAILQVVRDEEGLEHLPILYNLNFGHTQPIGIIPYGILAEIDCEARSLRLLESATHD
ncbi:MAG: S66 family peptidase [Bacillota bacterium]